MWNIFYHHLQYCCKKTYIIFVTFILNNKNTVSFNYLLKYILYIVLNCKYIIQKTLYLQTYILSIY